MKKYVNKFLILICIASLKFSAISSSEQLSSEFLDNDSNVRVEILPHELLASENGLFLVKCGEVFPLTEVYSDAKGIFTLINLRREDQITDTCLNGHQIYHYACGGCANWWCTFRCKCHSPWSLKNK